MYSLVRIHNYHAFSKLRFSELKLRQPINSIKSICSKTDSDVKECFYTGNDTSCTVKHVSNHSMESDVFGTLNKSLESLKKYKHKKYAPKQKTKGIVKINTPKIDESDVFGNLSEKKEFWYSDYADESKEVNDLSDDSVIVKNISKRYRCPKMYLREMIRLVKEKKVKDALGLFVDMRQNFVTPLHPHYTFMIGACGRVGYTEMAFKLLRQMTDRCYQPTPAVLTGLFNSCAESPFPEYGLKKARLLKEKIEMKSWQLNQITYHAMIKAFGKCGDLITAFGIVDEMAKADIKIDVDTYNFLLMSCISNKEAGFTYAVEVLRKLKAKNCLPNIFTCNLILRAARDCDIGPEEISCLLLQHWSSYAKRPYGFLTKERLLKQPILELKSGQKDSKQLKNNEDIKYQVADINYKDIKYEIKGSENCMKENSPSVEEEQSKYELDRIVNNNIAVRNSISSVSNLLTARPVDGPEILELVNIKTPSDRLSLIGGLEGFLKFMSHAKVKPNIKTLTLLLDCLPSNIEVEETLLSIIDHHEIKPDIDFFNMLIKRRNFRKDPKAAKNVLTLTNKYGLSPDIVTFGVLALGCRTLEQATVFISEMEKFGSFPNIEITGSMIRNACCHLDFEYMRYALKLMEEQDIKPNEKVLLLLEKTLKAVKENIIAMEQNKEVDTLYQQKNLIMNFKDFSYFYENWLKRVKLESEMHPWLQYKTDIIDRPKEEFIQS